MCSTAGTSTSDVSWSRSQAVTASVMRRGDSSRGSASASAEAAAARGDTKMTVSSSASSEDMDDELAVSSRPGVGARSLVFCRHFFGRLGRCAGEGVSLLALASLSGDGVWSCAGSGPASSRGAAWARTAVGAGAGGSEPVGMSALVSAPCTVVPTSACRRTSSTGRTLASSLLRPHESDASGRSERPRLSASARRGGDGGAPGGGGVCAITPSPAAAFELTSVLLAAPFLDAFFLLWADCPLLFFEKGSVLTCAGPFSASTFVLSVTESDTPSLGGDALKILFSEKPLVSRWSGLESLTLILPFDPLTIFPPPFKTPSLTAFLFVWTFPFCFTSFLLLFKIISKVSFSVLSSAKSFPVPFEISKR
ncbi:hypothetical protein ONE63_010274 [Megalurothrips usitatus]|uniref:Uncharacterized protein n=1 Tax=Megalurothrips usitatus TaxID=439358 RepID=A0AAV7XLH3_9NEOP|nr:hypothetical protein ONE63_010274 [Megalurothrips usitatus]